MLNWVQPFNIFCFLDSSDYTGGSTAFDCMLAVDAQHRLALNAGTALHELQQFRQLHHDWLFGHLSYDLKAETANLPSQLADEIQFPDLHFFVPRWVLQLYAGELVIYSDNDDALSIYEAIKATPVPIISAPHSLPAVQQRFSKAAYIQAITALRQHIRRGDCYEINFCQEFFIRNAAIDPLQTFMALMQVSPNPFAAMYRIHSLYCCCASPERYLQRKGNQLVSQPIKGTAKRYTHDAEKDKASKAALLHNQKERSENVMVVDLVRNDLSQIAMQGSVQVDELFGIYSFPQVHQMISTVSGTIDSSTSFEDIIRATFPMGSMTGAPKRSVMQLTERFERTKRGLYSGAIGYISPTGDFDFNVVIRSMLYNATTQYLSFETGSAITFYADAALEYEECLLKASAMMQALGAHLATP